jgi:hypothetical protein
MPTIREDDVLRVEPGSTGELTEDGDALANTEVEVLGATDVDTPGVGKVSWTKVRLFAAVKTPEGWMRSARVDLAGTPIGGPIDKVTFARQCWVEALFSDANAHYVAAVAEMASSTSRDQQAGSPGPQFGPFLFNQVEWDAARTLADFNLTTFGPRDISDWRMQIALFTLMTHRTEQAMSSELAAVTPSRRPTAAELYLAQVIGAKAAAAAVTKSPVPTIKDAFDGVSAADQAKDRPLGFQTFSAILTRHNELFGDNGSVKGDEAIDHIVARLDPVLATTKDRIIKTGIELLGSVATPQAIGNAGDPIHASISAASNVGDPPSGNVPGGVANAGGILGQLISRGEGDYGTFNRGNAGDAPHQKIDFSRVTIGDLTALQKLPPGNPRRLFAVGKYQVVPTTMKAAVSALAIGSNETFGPRLQEKVFRRYLIDTKRPQVKAFITGGSSNLAAAQLALAQEFASVADPATGRSFYDRIGGNRASISAQQAANALNAERAKFQQNRVSMSTQQAWEALSPGMS